MKWIDVTPYRPDDKVSRAQAWTCEVEGIRLVVSLGHIAYPGQWVLHCPPWFEATALGSSISTAAKAQDRAITLVRQRINLIANALKERAPT